MSRPPSPPPSRGRTDVRAPGVASPCVSLCRMDARTGWCEGCWRTLDEIAAWGAAEDAERLAILGRVQARREGVPAPCEHRQAGADASGRGPAKP